MPYFSFSLKQNFLIQNQKINYSEKILVDTRYYSKNTYLWKYLNKKSNISYLNSINFEKRIKIKFCKSPILFCLPPSLGLGDIVEYGLAIRAICESKKFENVGIAFVGRYKCFLKKYFDFKDIYEDILDEKILLKYKTIFHFSLEIQELKYQKYIRSDIESSILKYFNLEIKRKKCQILKKPNKVITIFPVSQSPIRSLQPSFVDSVCKSFESKYKIRIVFDKFSNISNFIEENMNFSNFVKFHPTSLIELCNLIEETEFGVFPDSGPLHVAKILGIQGVLINTSVNGDVLLNNFKTINQITNSYKSNFCKSPCGLTNLINFENRIGCYNSLKISKKNILSSSSLNSFQRGSIKDKYLDFMSNPVGCIENIDIKRIIKKIKYYIVD